MLGLKRSFDHQKTALLSLNVYIRVLRYLELSDVYSIEDKIGVIYGLLKSEDAIGWVSSPVIMRNKWEN